MDKFNKEMKTFYRTVKLTEYLKDTNKNVVLIEKQIEASK